MTRFYLRTSDEAVAGPFTGIELREAAMAQLVLPESGIAVSIDGPWTRAADAGLFSDTNVPLPHPAGTSVPEFRLTGVPEAFEGPFELRELIDFAVRKMLPSGASVQPIGRPDWIPVKQFGIVGACLRGELSRNPTSGSPSPAPNSRQTGPATASPEADLMIDSEEDIDAILGDHREQVRKNIREKIANQGKTKPKPKFKVAYAIGLVVPLLLVAVVLWWIMLPALPRTDRSKAIGNWVRVPSQKTGRAFGISFREDGTCVVYNSNGDCWSGEFQWSDAASSESGSESLTAMNRDAADMGANHQRDEVLASDGFVRLMGGSSSNPPMLGDKPIREFFLRKDDAFLWIGFLANVTPASQSRDADWVQLWPRNRAARLGSLEADMRGTDLLARYGVPDEARPLQPSEVTANMHPDSPEPRSLVRYGTKQLTLFADGSVRRFRKP